MGLRQVLLGLAWVGIGACGLLACSPDPAAQGSASPAVGAWSAADPYSPEVQEAARFAVQTYAVQNRARVLFKDVIHARQQGVAGLNYELQLLVTLDGAHKNVQVTVWRQPGGAYRLQGWSWVH